MVAGGESGSKRERLQGLRKYELGKTVGEGNFSKVKYARHVETGRGFAIKILEKKRVIRLKADAQIKREIGTLKLLKHPNVVLLHEVMASKNKIYMVFEYVTGGELFDKIASRGKLPECEGRKLFQQLMDAVSYCHSRGVYHRDLKLENVLIDTEGNIKLSDFGLSALPQHLRSDGLLHTTCGTPNYVAPEVLANRGYDGSTSDVWSCGVILYVILIGSLPFDDRNLAVLYQKIFKGEAHIPRWLSPGAKRLIKRMLDPNPKTRIKIDEIKSDGWFVNSYTPVMPHNEDDDMLVNFESFPVKEAAEIGEGKKIPTISNAFQLIGMSSYLDLSGLFEKEEVFERKIRFVSNHSFEELFGKIEKLVAEIGFKVQKRHNMLKIIHPFMIAKSPCSLSATAEVFEVSPSLCVVELRKLSGDSCLYRQLWKKLSDEVGDCQTRRSMAERPSSMLLICN